MKPVIVGISGPVLQPEETAFLREHAPAGIILFSRNIVDPGQLAALMHSLREVLRPEALLMVDQEGGRVARLRPPHWRAHPPARVIGDLHARDPERGQRAAWLTGALIGLECRRAGFDLVAAPVLDVAGPDGHDVIGDRSFSADPEAVATLGAAMGHGLWAGGVQPIGKHAPGHGRARADSHLELPVLEDVTDADLVPFRHNAWLPWMMTAHIRYTARDMQSPATQSTAIVQQVIRASGFAGLLITDDLAMGALHGSPAERAARALQAGCDIALHCSGVFADSENLLASLPDMASATETRLGEARFNALANRMALDEQECAAMRDRMLT